MNVLVCDDERQIVDSIIETLEKKTEETQVSSRFYGVSQPSQIDLSLPYDIALLDIDMVAKYHQRHLICVVSSVQLV